MDSNAAATHIGKQLKRIRSSSVETFMKAVQDMDEAGQDQVANLDFRAQLLGIHDYCVAKAATRLESARSADYCVPVNGAILGQTLVLRAE